MMLAAPSRFHGLRVLNGWMRMTNGNHPPELEFFDIDADSDAEAHVTSAELSVTRAKMGELLDVIPAGLMIHQEQGIVFANVEAERIVGISAEALVGRHIFDFIDEGDQSEVKRHFMGCLARRETVRGLDCAMISAGGGRVYVQLSMASLPWEGLPVIYILINDVDALKTTESVLRRLSITDPLTGAFNRRHFLEETARELERGRRYGRPLSVLLMDLDHFKRINDTHGHMMGDEVLRHFTNACQRLLRTSDVLGRIGGEEFAVVLPETGISGACHLAERIRAATAALGLEGENGIVPVTVSVGVATCPNGSCTVDHLLSRADKALYRAKAAGRDRVEGPTSQEAA